MVTTEKYDQAKIDRLKNFLAKMAEKGQPRFYEIFVDSFKAVPKTDDVAEFDSYEEFQSEDTEKIRILLYNTGNSPRNDQYVFMLKQQQANGLNGVGDINSIVQEKLDARDKEFEMRQLQAEFDRVKGDLEEAEEHIEDLEKKIEELNKQKGIKEMNLGNVLSHVTTSLIQSSPNIVKKYPLLGALGALAGDDTNLLPDGKTPEIPETPETKTTIRRRENPQESNGQILVNELMTELQNQFTGKELESVLLIIHKLGMNKEQIKTVEELLA